VVCITHSFSADYIFLRILFVIRIARYKYELVFNVKSIFHLGCRTSQFRKLISVSFFFSVLLIIPLFSLLVFASVPYEPYLHAPSVQGVDSLGLPSNVKNDLFTGAATYSYSLDVPPGTNGLAPSLSLMYSSFSSKQRSEFLADGWSLTTSYIQLVDNRTPLNNAFYHGKHYVLSIDGQQQELVYNSDENRFYTKREEYYFIENKTGGFNQNNQYWIVKKNDGTMYRFGYTNDSEMLNANNGDVWRWSLDTINDTYGNIINYSYLENPITLESSAVYPNKITYNNDQSRVVQFSYELSKASSTRDYVEDGTVITQFQVLKDITISADSHIVRRYSLGYDVGPYPIGPALLINISVFGKDNISNIPPITFDYYYPETGWDDINYLKAPTIFEATPSVGDTGFRLADVNGDGYVDILQGIYIVGGDDIRRTWLNTWSDWQLDNLWNSTHYFIHDNQFTGTFVIDVNGDGLSDVIRGDSSYVETYINNGSTFNLISSWAPPINLKDALAQFADVNGDGLIDIIDAFNGVNDIFINNGSNWAKEETPYWHFPVDLAEPSGLDNGVRLTDVNNDGFVDVLLSKAPSDRRAYINNGSGYWTDKTIFYPPIDFVLANGSDLGVRLMDINGDKRVDIVKAYGVGGNSTVVYLNNGSGWVQDNEWTIPEYFVDSNGFNVGVRIADLDGDGQEDIIKSTSYYDDYQTGTWRAKRDYAYLLKTITTPYGGNTTIGYRKTVSYNDQGIGFNLYVVANITQDNEITGSQKTLSISNYSYYGGIYNYSTKSFRGFSLVKEISPGNSFVDHYFYQDEALMSREYMTNTTNATKQPYKLDSYGWLAQTSKSHYIITLLQKNTSLYEGTLTSPKVASESYAYDAFGNVLEKHQFGDVSTSDDDRYWYYAYLNNSGLWIVNALQQSVLYADSTNVTKVRETLYSYDNQSYGSIPLRGDVTNEEKYFAGGTNPVKTYNYDSYGNLVEMTDELGFKTAYTYSLRDATHTFVDRIKNAKNHTVDNYYDLGTGNLLSMTDPNSVVTNYSYDTFWRKQKIIKPYDTTSSPTVSYSYSFDGKAPELAVTNTKIDAQNQVSQYQFIDGFGRVIQQKVNVTDEQQTVTNYFYNTIGKLVNKSNPYLVSRNSSLSTPDLSINQTSYSYDVLGRIVQAKNPDDSEKTIVFDHWKIIVTDENNHQKKYYLDAFEQIIAVTEILDGTGYNTTYSYSKAGEMVGITDALGNGFLFSYDTLGRKTGMNDPDMGEWNYTYDAKGNLLSQEDNRGQLNSISYDPLARPLQRNATNDSLLYTYDSGKKGTRDMVASSTYALSYVYDNRLRKITENKLIDDSLLSTNYSYNALDKVTQEILPDGQMINYTYDEHGLVSEVEGVLDNATFNVLNKIILRDYDNGLVSNYSYYADTLRLFRIRTGIIQNLSYAYDPVGNIVSVNDTPNERTFIMNYDTLDRLTYVDRNDSGFTSSEYEVWYTYDIIGNLLNVLFDRENLTFSYASIPIHSPSNYTDIVLLRSLELSNITVLHADGSYTVFEMIINNTGEYELPDVRWVLDLGDGINISSTAGVVLSPGESLRVFVEYDYGVQGYYFVQGHAFFDNISSSMAYSLGENNINIPLMIELLNSSTYRLFEVVVHNPFLNPIANVSWVFDYGDLSNTTNR